MDNSIDYSLGNTTKQALWLPTSREAKYKAKQAVDSFFVRMGDVDGRFDGAFLGGFSAAKGLFRVDGDGLWAAVGGDRPEHPFLRVDVDAIYFHLAAGVKVVKDLYVTGGVRRLALKYNVALGDSPEFCRHAAGRHSCR